MSPDSITLTDLSGIILYCNQQTAVVHGYENIDQILGTNVLTHFSLEEQAKIQQMIRDALTLEQINDTPFTMVKKDGSHFPGEIRACLVPGPDGNPGGIIGITRDIIERRQAETEREKLISELKSKNEELERFTYTVSHDLKSPLITIGGFLSYLEEDTRAGDVEKLQHDIYHINNTTNKMKRLLDDLLELSRIGRLMNPPIEVSFEEIIRDALDNVHGRLEARGVTVDLAPNLPTVYGDRQRLVEILQNLIDNASKFLGDQPSPRIEIGQRGEDGGKPVFLVRDNGVGIAPEHHERVFGLFDKLNPKTEGTGIGLSIVKRIIEYHGGRIWVTSEAGKGSTFWFTLGKRVQS